MLSKLIASKKISYAFVGLAILIYAATILVRHWLL